MADVLDLLPPLSPLADARAFLTKAMRRAVQTHREGRVQRDVYRARTDQLDVELATLESRRVLVTDVRLCPVCGKRLGASVVSVFSPGGETTHFACSRQFQATRKATAGV